jgi:hypothetical protein
VTKVAERKIRTLYYNGQDKERMDRTWKILKTAAARNGVALGEIVMQIAEKLPEAKLVDG